MRGPFRAVTLAVLGVATLAGCTEHHFEPPDREEQVEEADALYSQALFDSVTWASDSARVLRGNTVYSAECRQCHGSLGRGMTEYADDRSLEVPSLVEPDWELAGDLDGVRRRIFIGHADGMPTWGVAGISPREIDAAAHYVLEQLRPDVLEGGASLPGEPAATDSADASGEDPADGSGGATGAHPSSAGTPDATPSSAGTPGATPSPAGPPPG